MIAKDQGGGLWTPKYRQRPGGWSLDKPYSRNPEFFNFVPIPYHQTPSKLIFSLHYCPLPSKFPQFTFFLSSIFLKKIQFSSLSLGEISHHLPKDRQRPGGWSLDKAGLWRRGEVRYAMCQDRGGRGFVPRPLPPTPMNSYY